MEKPTGKKPPTAFPKALEIERTDFHISSAPTTAANLTQFKTRKEPFPVRLTFAPFRLILRLEKTTPTDAYLSGCLCQASEANRYNRLTEEMNYQKPVPPLGRPASERESSGSGQNGLKRAPIPDLEDTELMDTEIGNSDPQPVPENGVDRDMASIALDSALLKGAPIESAQGRTMGGQTMGGRAVADWGAMSDAEIMLRVREGDDSGFDLLIQKYNKPIIHFMFRMVHNQAVAEELAQEVFLRVYRSRHTYRAEARFSTWLYRIATNLGVNHARDTKHERAAQNVYLDQPDPETGTTPDVADMTATVEQELVRDERMRAIRQHVMALPERQRTAVLMHKYQGLDYKQIGEVLKLSESATKSLLFRAYQTLRERLKDFV